MYQKLQLIGNLGRDPEQRFTAQGQSVTSFSVATSERWNDDAGNAQERTTWWRISAWGRLGEVCNEYLSKGSRVFIEGTLREPKPYQARDGGEWRASLEVTAREVKFLSVRGESQSDGPATEHEESHPETVEEIPFN